MSGWVNPYIVEFWNLQRDGIYNSPKRFRRNAHESLDNFKLQDIRVKLLRCGWFGLFYHIHAFILNKPY